MAWTAGSDYFLFANEGHNKTGVMELMSFKNDRIELQATITAHTSICDRLQIDKSFTKLAVGSFDKTVSLWDLEDLYCYKSISVEDLVDDLSFNKDSTLLAIAVNKAKSFVIIDTTSGDIVHKIDYNANSVAWHPTADLLVAGVRLDKSFHMPSCMKLFSFNSSSR